MVLKNTGFRKKRPKAWGHILAEIWGNVDAELGDTGLQSELTQVIQILSEDSTLWLERLNDEQRCELVERGPKQLMDFEFPQNNDNVPRLYKGELLHSPEKWRQLSDRGFCILSLQIVFCFCCVLFGKHNNSISKDSFSA